MVMACFEQVVDIGTAVLRPDRVAPAPVVGRADMGFGELGRPSSVCEAPVELACGPAVDEEPLACLAGRDGQQA
jgi:hypothetical protein